MDAGATYNITNNYGTPSGRRPPPPPPQAAAQNTNAANGNVFFGEKNNMQSTQNMQNMKSNMLTNMQNNMQNMQNNMQNNVQHDPMPAAASPESTLKDIIMQIMSVLGMTNPLDSVATPQEVAEAENDWGYSEGFSMLTKGELEGRIEDKALVLTDVDQQLADSASTLDSAAIDYDTASTEFTEASSAYEQEKSSFASTEAEYLEQHDRYETLVAARDAKLNGTEMTKEPAYAGNTEEGENDWGYSEGFSMLTVEELDARIAAKEVVLEKVDQEFEVAAESFVAAAGSFEAAATDFESASLSYEQAQDSHTAIEAEHFEQHDRFAKLNEALEAKA